ncbi:DUF6808 domain-containing protein [Myroides odoratimimus]|uniref:DUF6808 domain-containing protein n=1 Tax=Myroides odoratimimus TaxID=76832 RepID=UPI0025762BCB|nr:hypothetical protein [Myroides odoratimimus]MDM1093420.1 hypothetical protein [Myroides odoratimimus]
MKNLIIMVLSCLTITLGIFAFKQYKESKEQQVQYKELLTSSGKNEVVKEYIRDSIKHTVYVEKKIKDTELEKRLAISSQYADSLERALKVSISQIKQVTKVNAELDATLKLVKQQDGTVTYQDKYLSLLYKPQEELLDLNYKVNLNIARYSKRTWLLAPKSDYIDIYSDDPRVTIKGLNSFTLQEKPVKRFGIGISTGYAVTLNNNQLEAKPYIGIGLNYNLINF